MRMKFLFFCFFEFFRIVFIFVVFFFGEEYGRGFIGLILKFLGESVYFLILLLIFRMRVFLCGDILFMFELWIIRVFLILRNFRVFVMGFRSFGELILIIWYVGFVGFVSGLMMLKIVFILRVFFMGIIGLSVG